MSNSEKPRYQQLKDLIITQISSGELGPHDRVPSENELVESMQVSRMTANRALRELTDEGYVERIAGRGTFVSDFRSRSHMLEVQNIADEIEQRGHRHTCDVLRNSRQHARGEIARALHVEQGTRRIPPVTRAFRERRADTGGGPPRAGRIRAGLRATGLRRGDPERLPDRDRAAAGG